MEGSARSCAHACSRGNGGASSRPCFCTPAPTIYRHQRRFYVRDKRIGIVLAGWAAWQLLTGFMTPFVDNFAHLGGLFGGVMAAFLLTPTLTARASFTQVR